MSLPCDYARCAGYEDVPQCQTCARNWRFNGRTDCYRFPEILPPKPEGECEHRIACEVIVATDPQP